MGEMPSAMHHWVERRGVFRRWRETVEIIGKTSPGGIGRHA